MVHVAGCLTYIDFSHMTKVIEELEGIDQTLLPH